MPLPSKIVTAPALVPAPELAIEPSKKTAKPPARCLVCTHDNREQIEHFYADNRTVRWISDWLLKNGKMHVREGSIDKHFKKCLAGALVRDNGADRSVEALLRKLEDIADRMTRFLDEIENAQYVCAQCNTEEPKGKERDYRGAASLAREIRGCLELWAKVLGHVRPDVEINIINNPRFMAIVNPICQITAGCARCAPKIDAIMEEAEG